VPILRPLSLTFAFLALMLSFNIQPSFAAEKLVIKSTVSAKDTPVDYKQTIITRKLAQLKSDKEQISNFYNEYNNKIKEVKAKDYAAGESVNADELIALSKDIASNMALASYLLEDVRTTQRLVTAEQALSLSEMEEEVTRLVADIKQQEADVKNESQRYRDYMTAERNKLEAVANASSPASDEPKPEQSTTNAAQNIVWEEAPAPNTSDAAPLIAPHTAKPLMTIKFNRPDVNYEQPLNGVVAQVLKRYPDASFELVAMSNAMTDTRALEKAQIIATRLVSLGVVVDRITQSFSYNPGSVNPEVHIFLKP